MAATLFLKDKPLTFDCDLDLGRGNLNFVRDTSHFVFVRVLDFSIRVCIQNIN